MSFFKGNTVQISVNQNLSFYLHILLEIQPRPTCSSDCCTLAAAAATCSSRKDNSMSDVELQIPRAHSSRSLSSASRLYTDPAATYTCSTFNKKSRLSVFETCVRLNFISLKLLKLHKTGNSSLQWWNKDKWNKRLFWRFCCILTHFCRRFCLILIFTIMSLSHICSFMCSFITIIITVIMKNKFH